MHPGQIPATGETTIILPFEEFAADLEHNLGRANGNCFQRKTGIPGVHDGQIMIRLKKKRFIVLDYSMVPTPADVACASVTPHIKCPPGAGMAQCTAAGCNKIGVPICLFDSNPDEPTSLYLRSGLCFSCQRLLNEKRRTQRKRKGDVQGKPNSGSDNYNQKRVRVNNEILDVHADAIILNGPFEGTKHHGPGYGYMQIIADLQKIGQEVAQDTTNLANCMNAIGAGPSPPNPNTPQHIEMDAIYNKAFHTISKGIFLISEFKSSYDAAVTASIAEKATEEVLESASIADVVASAAAVAAAQSAEVAAAAAGGDAVVAAAAGGDQSSSNMIPLLLAAKEGDAGGAPILPQEEAKEVNQEVEI